MERFKILRAALNPAIGQRLNDSYVFAWEHLRLPHRLGQRCSTEFASDFDFQEPIGRSNSSKGLLDTNELAHNYPSDSMRYPRPLRSLIRNRGFGVHAAAVVDNRDVSAVGISGCH